jgi:hypothetical protein
MSPEMTEVVYSINFALWQRDGKAGRSKILEAIHPVQILPTRNEHLLILVPGKNKYYGLRAEQSLSTVVLRHSLANSLPALPNHRLSSCKVSSQRIQTRQLP